MKADWTTECTKQRRNRNRILFREGTVKCLRYCSCIRKLKSLASRKSIAYKAIRYAEKDTTHTSSTVSRAYTAVIGDCCRITQNDRQPCLGLLVNTKSCNGTVQRAIEKDSLILETFLVRCRTAIEQTTSIYTSTIAWQSTTGLRAWYTNPSKQLSYRFQ